MDVLLIVGMAVFFCIVAYGVVLVIRSKISITAVAMLPLIAFVEFVMAKIVLTGRWSWGIIRYDR